LTQDLNKLLGADQQKPDSAGAKDSELTLAALTGGRTHLNLEKF
jgi:hypothetical protein